MNQIEKKHGAGSVMKLGKNARMKVDVISTGSMNLDKALSVGGVPRGRVIEIYGPESSGKTTLALHIIAEAQKAGGIAAFIDAEHALDPTYAEALGVDIDELIISQPDNGEQALEIVDDFTKSGALDIIVVDSVAALVPLAEIEGEMGDQQMGLQARLMSKALRKLAGNLNKSKTTIVFINQIREIIGGFGYGPKTTTSGGRALKFYSSVRLEIKRIGRIKQGEAIIGNETVVKVNKNKVGPPYKEARFQIMFGKGISKIGEILEIAVENKIIIKSGTWFKYNNANIGQGVENAKIKLEEDQELFLEVQEKINKLKL
jgi:recombination protein RecA